MSSSNHPDQPDAAIAARLGRYGPVRDFGPLRSVRAGDREASWRPGGSGWVTVCAVLPPGEPNIERLHLFGEVSVSVAEAILRRAAGRGRGGAGGG